MTSDSDAQKPLAPSHIDPQFGSRPIAVIGGGVIGASTAYYLAKQGATVLLIDKGAFGKGASHGNCGYISPSGMLPLNGPGVFKRCVTSLFQKNPPLKMRWQLDRHFWLWFASFARHCNQVDRLAAAHTLNPLLQSSRRIYQKLIEKGTLENCDWKACGALFVFQQQQNLDAYGLTNDLIQKEFGVSARRLEQAELLELEPALKPTVAGAWFQENDAQLRPDMLMAAWKTRLQQQGVVIREHCELIQFEQSHHGVSAILTTAGRIEVEQVVVATGAWTRLLRNELRMKVPIEPVKGYSVTMNRPAICPTRSMIIKELQVGISPYSNGYRLGSTLELAGFDSSVREERIEFLMNGARSSLHEPIGDPIYEKWAGWRPVSADGIPMIGLVPSYKNLWMAAGHGMLGVSMAPATGKLVAELMCGCTPHIDPKPYRLDRL